MKKIFTFFLFFITLKIFPQVIISPYIVLIDENNRYGSFIVQNESNQAYEVTISFIFGFPQSDSSGNLSMQYIENPDTTFTSAAEWVRAFPKKFVLEPKQRQMVRMSVNPKRELISGTYWTRIVTSSAPLTASRDSVGEGISASIKFVLNQITTLLYRINPAESGAGLSSVYSKEDSAGISFYADLQREGNSPFFGDFIVTISNDKNEVIEEKSETISLYYNLIKQISFENLPPGSYSAEIKIIHNEKKDIPESSLINKSPITRKLQFTIN